MSVLDTDAVFVCNMLPQTTCQVNTPLLCKYKSTNADADTNADANAPANAGGAGR